MITTLAVHGYRSLADVVLPLGKITLVTGANGTGKSNLYKALRLLAETASGQLIGALAREGGLPQVLHAGPEQLTGAMRRGEQPVQGASKRARPVSLMLGFASDDLGYLIDIGYPTPSQSMFTLDPIIKREHVFAGPQLRPAATLVTRRRGAVTASDASFDPGEALIGERESLITEFADPINHPEVRAIRRTIRGWRFYDSFRVDQTAPARAPHVGTWTPVLAADGADLAPAVQTILESAMAEPFTSAIADAFDGAQPAVAQLGLPGDASRPSSLLELVMRQPGLLRPLSAAELSDGTLRYLLLASALLSPRPPGLLILNEPESSLHPDVLPALARLVGEAAKRTQVVVISHSEPFIAALVDTQADLVHHELVKPLGRTEIADQGLLSRPAWQWGSR